jgi:hypothetical protein
MVVMLVCSSGIGELTPQTDGTLYVQEEGVLPPIARYIVMAGSGRMLSIFAWVVDARI